MCLNRCVLAGQECASFYWCMCACLFVYVYVSVCEHVRVFLVMRVANEPGCAAFSSVEVSGRINPLI